MSLKTLKELKWLNEPAEWDFKDGKINVLTDKNTDFWRNTWYGFRRDSGHVYGWDVFGDFTFQACVEADFTTLYDQAGLMIRVDEYNWMKAGIEYNDGQPMIGSVLTKQDSDWATGIFKGNPKKFWMRLTRVKNVLRLQYSSDGATWPLLRLCTFTDGDCFVGVMCCTPERGGLKVQFSEISLTEPLGRARHPRKT